MFEVIVVTHGQYGKAMVESAELLMGPIQHIKTFGLSLGDSVDELKDRVERAMATTKEEVLVLTDLQSGSPFNVTCALMSQYPIQHLTGINLPILLEILCMRETKTLLEIISHVMEIREQTCVYVNEMLKEV